MTKLRTPYAAAGVLCASTALVPPTTQAQDRIASKVPVLVARTSRSLQAPVALGSLGLGSGGVHGARAKTQMPRAGELVTPGGIRVVAKPQGVLVQFPGGRRQTATRDLLIGPDGFVHLRGGHVGSPSALGGRVELHLADGSVVVCQTPSGIARGRRGGRSASPTLQAAFVRVPDRRAPISLFRGGRMSRRGRAVEASFWSLPAGTVWYALGDGRTLYRPIVFGPLAVLEQVVAPADSDPGEPSPAPWAVVVSGDVLYASLRRLPELIPRERIQSPTARLASLRLAETAGRLVPSGVRLRPPGGMGDLMVPLGDGFVLSLEVFDAAKVGGWIRLGLTTPGARAPVVDWIVPAAGRVEVNMLRRDAGTTPTGPRYVGRGLSIEPMLKQLWPQAPVPGRDQVRARQLLRRIGARDPGLDRAARQR